VGAFASLTSLSLFYAGLIPSGVKVNTRYATSLFPKTHFLSSCVDVQAPDPVLVTRRFLKIHPIFIKSSKNCHPTKIAKTFQSKLNLK
jgi:hypothetical protein